MEVNIGGERLQYDGRKQSLLASHKVITQEDGTYNPVFLQRVNEELLGFAQLIPDMKPTYLVVIGWDAHPLGDYFYGIGAIGCNTITPWRNRGVDHIIQRNNPFRGLGNQELLTEICLQEADKAFVSGTTEYMPPKEDIASLLEQAGYKVFWNEPLDFMEEFGLSPYDDWEE